MLIDENNQALGALKEVALAGIVEQRRTRRWNIFFKVIMLIFALLFILSIAGAMTNMAKLSDPKLSAMVDGEDYAAMVTISGVIMDGESASANNLIPALQKAFKDESAKGVVLRCNSPGGSPVQSNLVYEEIMRLRDAYPEKKVYAVAEDVCASGGYYIIAAAQKIFADKSSIVGSIGVRMDSFGFVDVMKKIGVESRQITAGKNKALLDPFKPQRPQDIAHLESLLGNTHKHFIDAVKAGRGDRIDVTKNPDLFSGLFWSGDQAQALGLVDAIGSTRSVAREELKAERLVEFTQQSDIFERLSKRLGTSVRSALNSAQDFKLN
ncbi:S49 family peptidase [Leucothrix arctica]|uniref:S49 family peptidase n=1 Tax=Leucothrix arctica TaxID=1481894 RepID=A0A317C5K4_9GAMM|nr:S49 family peptidase [Leucothrix arctica]PWQ93874.1 S49 family peptidase [Leucothrix arctica]